ncbi:MAG: phosphatase PAP2 family protein [Ferruginibacter sp.]
MLNRLKSVTVIFLFPCICYAQEPVKADTLIKKLDSLQAKPSEKNVINNVDPEAYNENTNLNFRTYFILLGSDLKQQFTVPFHTKKKEWMKTAAFAGIVAGLTFTDKPINKFTTRITNSSNTISSSSHFITKVSGLYETYTLAALGLYGFVVKNQKLKTTTLIATQAYITGAVVESVLKALSGRQRPNYIEAVTKQNKPTFNGPFGGTKRDIYGKKLNSSFPSGHAVVAFAAATVFAKEYRDIKWVPIVAYSAAGLIGASRLTENKHWFTDVVAGGVLGFLTGKQIVNNYHRFARIKTGGDKKNTVSFNMSYSMGNLQPGMVWKFN